MEGLSTPFSFELELLSENHSIPFQDIIGKTVAISIVLANGEKRYFNGLISRFSQGRGSSDEGGNLRLAGYTATMVPWFWLLTRTADSRIFQNLSVPEIVEKIFKEKGFLDYKNKLHVSYDKWDYCVQYRETDFNFICRLLEEEGIYYFFEHEDKKHTLVLSDAPEEHKSCPNQKTARYQISAGGWLEEDTLLSLEVMQEIKPGKYTLKDFNFETPNTDLQVEALSQKALGPGEREIYDYYPCGYGKRDAGDQFANIRMQEEEAEITIVTGSSNCRAFTSGYRFKLTDYYRKDMNNKAYVITSLSHSARQGYATEDTISEFSYVNSFKCIPFDVPYRPPRRTPKPVVEGVQTAIVVGPSGEEIYTDEHGRVKVQFHWDREGKKDDKSSCWIRVSQLWAGAGWGAMYIPRIGQEVIIDFIEGDPDCPIIIGRVYHGVNKPPYPLPDEKTKSTIKTRSSKGGNESNFNEIRFEDKKGDEHLLIHAEKNQVIEVENDETTSIGHDRTETVGHDEKLKVKNDRTEEILGAQKETIHKTCTQTIYLSKALSIGAGYQISVGGIMNETVVGAKTEEVGGFRLHSVGLHHTVKVGKSYSLKAKDITIEADEKIEIKCGSASITLKKDGRITITGETIDIEGSNEISVVAKNNLDLEGGKFTLKAGTGQGVVNAATILEIKGATVKINS